MMHPQNPAVITTRYNPYDPNMPVVPTKSRTPPPMPNNANLPLVPFAPSEPAAPKRNANGTQRRRIEPVRYKTRMCRHFLETGYCPFAPKCAFAHGEHELRSIQNNAAEGLTHLSKLRDLQQQRVEEEAAAAAYHHQGNTCPCPDCVNMSYYSTYAPQGYCGSYTPGCPCPDCMQYASVPQYAPYGEYPADPSMLMETGSTGSGSQMASLDEHSPEKEYSVAP